MQLSRSGVRVLIRPLGAGEIQAHTMQLIHVGISTPRRLSLVTVRLAHQCRADVSIASQPYESMGLFNTDGLPRVELKKV
jgi:hypothetical protein